MPRFVILEHDWPYPHFDLMLEADGVLHTWRMVEPPNGAQPARVVEPLPDHRIDYLEYEGPLTGNRGQVWRWDSGEYEWLEVGRSLRIEGVRWRGTLHLTRE